MFALEWPGAGYPPLAGEAVEKPCSQPHPWVMVALGFVQTRGQILTVFLLPAPGERPAFLLKGPSDAELCLDGGSCVCLELQPSLQFWNRFLQLEALMPVRSCTLLRLWGRQTRVGASRGQMSRRPPQHHHGPQLLPICRMGLRRPCRRWGRGCYACHRPAPVGPCRARAANPGAWGQPPSVCVKRLVSP